MCLTVVPPDEVFVLNVPGSARVAIVTTNVGIHGLCCHGNKHLHVPQWHGYRELEDSVCSEGFGRETVTTREGFHIIMNQ